MTDWRGVHVPLISPFTHSGRLDEHALAALGSEVLDAGAAGLVALGTTAEPAALSLAERRAVIDVCADLCRDRPVGLVVGAGSNDTASTRAALADLARWPEIDAAMVTVPYFLRPSEAGVVAHVTELARTSPVPLIVYHVPYRTGLPLGPGCLRELLGIDGVVGMKYAPGVIDAGTVDLLGDLPDATAVLAGDDVLAAPLLGLGARGAVLASAHLATAEFVRFVRAADPVGHRRLGHALARWSAAAFAEPNPAVVKGVLHALGRIASPRPRLPLLPARPATVEHALLALDHLTAAPVGPAQRAGAS
ncbi:dihydrodipicolinate synthase family protein [Pseudonocardia abyssalis]|uniref:Dihydrodipicolinate synthase family protein n=1 Tax=Pseudonocardia abyssalis TaxID=2792008 RepID=A0ABS6USS7_9PSEU|nr:dihydrodipicolinate synthase family protein [Pseudonocardia abyssalis]MBW0116374.1 dihydrodipicolinate synthase family protein [Pseudonocardia abyssalis]MBW0135305.1 dihydrodipicolinate synthase family protein [Pseudonocardia abyssalis]